MGTEFIFVSHFRLHERATVAMRGRVDSKIIFEHLQNMKNEHLENSFLKPDQEQIVNRLLIELKFRGFELEEKQQEILQNAYARGIRADTRD